MTLTQIKPDIWQLRLPLPFRLDHVNVYLLQGTNGWSIVDTGLNTSAVRQTWQNAFTELGIRPSEIEQIVLTHEHPDHYGLAGWLQSLNPDNPPPVKLSQICSDFAERLWRQSGSYIDMMNDFFQVSGLPEEIMEPMRQSTIATAERTKPHPLSHEIIEPSSTIRIGNRLFRAELAVGHSDGQLVFYDENEKLLLSGDHVLMKITPHIGAWPLSGANPLAAYLDSLRHFSSYDVELALPGHKELITNWHGRLQELLIHHDERIEQTLNYVTNGVTAANVSQKLFGTKLNAHNARFAIAETVSHLDYLIYEGKVQKIEQLGVNTYQRID